MSESNLFELAAVRKYRFQSPKGFVLLEDLYDLSYKDLNTCAQEIYADLQQEAVDFVNEQSQANADLTNRLELVKAVIAYKKRQDAEREDAKIRRLEQARRKEMLLETYLDKEKQELGNLSKDEVLKQLKELS